VVASIANTPLAIMPPDLHVFFKAIAWLRVRMCVHSSGCGWGLSTGKSKEQKEKATGERAKESEQAPEPEQ